MEGLIYNIGLICAVGAIPRAPTVTNSNVLSRYLQHYTLFAYQSETKKEGNGETTSNDFDFLCDSTTNSV